MQQDNQFEMDFYNACDQSRVLNVSNSIDRKYYTDFSSLRCAKILDQDKTLDQIGQIERRIVELSPNDPSSHLFTGNIGCGKSTELLRLKNKLEEQNFEVIYYSTEGDLKMSDVSIPDILLGIANQIIKYFSDNSIPGTAKDFGNLLNEFIDFLNSDISGIKVRIPKVGDFGFQSDKGKNTLSFVLGEIVTQSRNSASLREVLRERTMNYSSEIVNSINKELIVPHQKYLKEKDKKTGLVVIADGLDKMESGCHQQVYLSSGTELKDLSCHMVYTVPFSLAFGTNSMKLQNKFGILNVLPLVRIYSFSGEVDSEGMKRMHEMILRRAFPRCNLKDSEDLILQIFDCIETLNRLCFISGGNIRKLLTYIRSCIGRHPLPISEKCLDWVIRDIKNAHVANASDWEALAEVRKTKRIEEKHYKLLEKLYVAAYVDEKGDMWFDIDPLLAEIGKL